MQKKPITTPPEEIGMSEYKELNPQVTPINIYVELVSAKKNLDGCAAICGHLPQFAGAQASINKVLEYLDKQISRGLGI